MVKCTAAQLATRLLPGANLTVFVYVPGHAGPNDATLIEVQSEGTLTVELDAPGQPLRTIAANEIVEVPNNVWQ